MRTSLKGILEIAEHEDIVPAPYRDSVGVWTFGVGHTAAAGSPNPASMQKGMPDDLGKALKTALDLFRNDLGKYEARVNRMLGPVTLSQHQYDALVSWDFNTGGATWRSPSGSPCQLVREIHAGDFSGKGFMGWLRPPEIRKRRKAEMGLFRTGNYDANGDDISVWRVSESGKLNGVLRTMSGAEMLDIMDMVPRPWERTEKRPSGLAELIRHILSLFRRK